VGVQAVIKKCRQPFLSHAGASGIIIILRDFLFHKYTKNTIKTYYLWMSAVSLWYKTSHLEQIYHVDTYMTVLA